ncbi:MAG: RNA polymerase sigma factor [Bacteroidota bacterium]
MKNPDFHSEAELVRACLKNNRQAQKELYRRFSYMMKGVCLRYSSNTGDAEDLLQESFIRVFQNLHRYQDEGKLGGWIRTVTLNCVFEKYRSMKKEKESLLYVEEYFEKAQELDHILENLAMEDLLAKIQALPEGYRVMFNLYAIEGYRHEEIAQQLGIREGTSKSQYSRARALLREMLLKEGYFHSNTVNYDK